MLELYWLCVGDMNLWGGVVFGGIVVGVLGV